jgi:hypothetical protein
MQEKIYVIISYNFQLIDLWSINLGSWDLAADKSAIKFMKVRHKKSMQMANKKKYPVPFTKLGK